MDLNLEEIDKNTYIALDPNEIISETDESVLFERKSDIISELRNSDKFYKMIK
jgi:hypothetical protein